MTKKVIRNFGRRKSKNCSEKGKIVSEIFLENRGNLKQRWNAPWPQRGWTTLSVPTILVTMLHLCQSKLTIINKIIIITIIIIRHWCNRSFTLQLQMKVYIYKKR